MYTIYSLVKIMKKTVMSLTAAVITIFIAVMSIVPYFAYTYYVYEGYKYRDIDNGSIAFSGWEGDTDALVIPDNIGDRYVTIIDSYAFSRYSNLKSIDLTEAKHLNRINESAFEYCYGLGSMTVPEWIERISDFAFFCCTSLKTLNLQARIDYIPEDMCCGCSSLESICIPDSVKEIKRYAFGNCTSLTYAEIPSTVTTIESSAFNNCPNLTLGVYFGSYAYEFAKTNNINYSLLDGIKLGDVNGDNIVNVDDATVIQKYLAELETLEGIYLHAADSNEDTEIDVSDATAIQMYSVELQTGHPIGQVMTK